MNVWRCLVVSCVVAVGCGTDPATPSPPLVLPHGQSELNIAGVVTDAAGRPVYDVAVEGWVGRDCMGPSAFIPTVRTFSSGRYMVRVRIGMSGGTWPGCVFLSFTPPEDSGFSPVTIDSIPSLVYDRRDPRLESDTLKVNAILPADGS